jgi:hypothetical protein
MRTAAAPSAGLAVRKAAAWQPVTRTAGAVQTSVMSVIVASMQSAVGAAAAAAAGAVL